MRRWRRSKPRQCSLSSCHRARLLGSINTRNLPVKRSPRSSAKSSLPFSAEGAVAERRTPRYRVQSEYRFDRLQPDKLRQAYQLLVPERRAEIRSPEVTHETDSDLRPRVLGLTEGAGDHSQPNGGS